MKKVALIFALAVFVPSLLLAWLAVRSLRDQQLILERQQSLLCQGVADNIAQQVSSLLADQQREFSAKVEAMLSGNVPADLAGDFDAQLRRQWPLAQIGFAVSLDGNVLSPSVFGGPEARRFRVENDKFLCNRESVEVYWNSPKGAINLSQLDNEKVVAQQKTQPVESAPQQSVDNQAALKVSGKLQARNIILQPQAAMAQQAENDSNAQRFSKVTAAEAEFRQLVGESQEGTLARFLQNKLNLMFWYRSPRDPYLVFGSLIDLARLNEGLRPLVRVESPLSGEIAVALLDDTGRPTAVSPADFHGNWKRPFVATEMSEALPHWEAAVYLRDPAKFSQAARTVKITIGLLVAGLVVAIAVGGWLIISDLRREFTLARQKTDFVSNVSHELKTPLTSIRMFSELLAEGRVADPVKQRSYLQIISAEASRLSRLINNVLDFARIERGEKKYELEAHDIVEIVRETVESYRPHLENNGFKIACVLPQNEVRANVDRDAIAQVVLNLLSNAEKYSDTTKEISVEVAQDDDALEIKVCDRGRGVPRGLEEKIFQNFFRADQSLSGDAHGSGLGLTLARQIARAHDGEIRFERRAGGGSCFGVRLPGEQSRA